MPVDLSVFQSAAPYKGFKREDWSVLSESLTEKPFKGGDFVFKENEAGDGFYWIRSGKVRISRKVVPEGKKEPQEQLLTLLTAGNVFGEMALVDGAPRSADARVEDSAVLFYLSKVVYEKLQQEHPSTALRIQDVLVVTLSFRLREANRGIEVIRFLIT